MTILFSKRTRLGHPARERRLCRASMRLTAWLLSTVAALAQGDLVETDFDGWTITQTIVPANEQGASVAGASEPEASGGRHFVARHTHSLVGGGSPLQIGSAVLGPDDYDPAMLGLTGIATFEVTLGLDVDSGFNPTPVLTPKVDWRPVLEQSGVLYRPSFRLPDAVLIGQERTLSYDVAPEDWSFPPGLDLGPGAARVRVGVEISTQASVLANAPSIEARVSIDDFRVSAGGGVSFGFTTTDLSIPGETIHYTVEVVNSGDTEASGLYLLETVPSRTTFVAAESDPRWLCDPGPDAGSECRLDLGELSPESLIRLSFTVLIDDSAPETFEVWNQLSLESEVTPGSAANQVLPSTTRTTQSRVYAESCGGLNRARLAVDLSVPDLIGCSMGEQVPAFGGVCCIVFNFDEDELCEGTHCVVRCPVTAP